MGKPAVVGGFDVAFDCAGSAASLEDAVRWTRSQGQVVLVGMPGPMRMDLAPLWYQEVRLTGAYAYGMESHDGRRVKTFELALEVLARGGLAAQLETLVRHRFPLRRYRQAIATAMRPGKFGAVKTVFDLRDEAPPADG
jgi:threonine dehydrogenase-like Zn-dependent dehydrogenase